MRKEISAVLKAYMISIVVLLTLILVLAAILINNPATLSYGKIMLKIALGITFFSMGFLFGNHGQRQGIIRGLLSGTVTILIVYLIYFLNDEAFNFMFAAIDIICAGLGGLIGVYVKKLI